jgi:hypothetical protein
MIDDLGEATDRLDLGQQETRGAVALRERGAPPPQRKCGR